MADTAKLEYIINHVFLPPKLPQEDDRDSAKSAALAEELVEALRAFRTYSTQQDLPTWTSLARMVENMSRIRDESGDMNPDKLEQTLLQMVDGGMFTKVTVPQNMRG